MKKSILLFSVLFCALAGWGKPPVYADDYLFQKQLLVGDAATCQTVRIAQEWFLTAAHCVVPCIQQQNCKLRVVLAAGEVSALADIKSGDVMVPPMYQTTDKEGRPVTHTYWDVALMRFHPQDVFFQLANGMAATLEHFKRARAEDEDLEAQWIGFIKPKYPTLYTFDREQETPLKTDLFVPLWERGEMTILSEPKQVLYLGQRQSLWASAGFGVDHGNSGGGVFWRDGALLGIATAKRVNDLPTEIKQQYPAFAQTDEFFLFNGFSKKTTFEFIKRTLADYGASVKAKELRTQEIK